MTTVKNQQEINDEILNRLNNIQFKCEKLIESNISNKSLFDISNDESLQLISLKNQYLNEIYEAYSNNIIDGTTFRLINEKLDQQQQQCYGSNKSYFDNENFFNFVNTKISINETLSNLNIKINELDFNDFNQFKKQYEFEYNITNKELNIFNDIDKNDINNDQNETYDYLFDFKIMKKTNENKQTSNLMTVVDENKDIIKNKFTNSNINENNTNNRYINNDIQSIQKANSINFNNNSENSYQQTSSNFKPSNFNQSTTNTNNTQKISSIKYEPRFSKCYKRKNDDNDDNSDSNSGSNSNNEQSNNNPFRSAKEQLLIDNNKSNNNSNNNYNCYNNNNNNSNVTKKSLGTTKRGIHSKFNLPIRSNEDNNNNENGNKMQSNNYNNNGNGGNCNFGFTGNKGNNINNNNNNNNNSGGAGAGAGGIDTSNLKNIDQKLIDIITSEIMDQTPPISWNDIAGLEHVKKTIKEIVIWPMLRPDIFNGLRGPPKGLLLFGPPGTGKTLIAKCIANESKSKFFNISSSCLTSKWQGESEKLVKVLFEVARSTQPSVIFIDEIDSLLAQRSDDDRESSRRLKTEFFVQMDGARTTGDERILLIGATNRPQELDDAARRRFVKRLYIPLPDKEGRRQIIVNLMRKQPCDLTEYEVDKIAELTDGYSGADMGNLCREAALGPIRTLEVSSIETINIEQVREINFNDFHDAMQQVRASVSQNDLDQYITWNGTFGSIAIK